MFPASRRTTSLAFTLVEILIVIVIIGVLAALITPQLSGAANDAKVAKILQVSDAIRAAVQGHYNDTGQLPRENSNSTNTNQHHLSLTQATTGWKGPYLDHPLTSADNPFGGRVEVLTSFAGDAGGGFDLMGSGSDTVTGNGSYMIFRNVPQEVGQAANDIVDQGIGGDWKQTGRIEWTNNRLIIFIMDIPG